MSKCRILMTPLKQPDEIKAGYRRLGLKKLTGTTRVNPRLAFTRTQFTHELPRVQKGIII